jgi:hypothetical protein
MPHLIAPIHDVAIADCVEQLTRAHECLVTAAKETLEQAVEIAPQYWGSEFKKLRVILPESRPPVLQQEDHNLGEVVNQVAGIERLLDGLRWFAASRPTARIESCHPSTSSAPGENDVVLSDIGEVFRIEVFDISGAKITNDKLGQTLRTFGLDTGWVVGRLVLFVSASVAPRISPRTPNGRYYFSPLFEGDRTHILELLHP